MDGLSRRALIAGLGVGLSGVLAGCGAPTAGRSPPETPTAEPEATPTPTPDPAKGTPEFWGWLPRPDVLGSEYSFGSLAVPAVRDAGLARERLAPARFTPERIDDVVSSTTALLTVSTGAAAGGVLRGEYDAGAFGDALESAGLAAGENGVYTGDRLGFALDSGVVRWADHPSDPAGVLAILRQQLAGAEDSYPTTSPPVERTLAAIQGASARFGRPIDVADGPLASARFLANGVGPVDGSVAWTSAVAFDGDVPDAVAEEYRGQFVDREGFENVRGRTEPGLLVIESETSAERASATQPL
jgi:hypothetical protein